MAPKAKYALAVLGWSGSMMFERDLKYVPATLACPFALIILASTLTDDMLRTKCKSSSSGSVSRKLTLPDYRNLKFDSGRFADRSTGEEYFPKTEREIFDILDLRYVRPKWRNADA